MYRAARHAALIGRATAVALRTCCGVIALVLAGCASTPLPPVDGIASHALKAEPSSLLGQALEQAKLPQGMSGFRPLAEGQYDLDARITLINHAKVSIDYQTYLLTDDSTGRLILRSLRDAAKRGVRVRLLVDDFYTKGEDPLFLGLAAYPNAEVRLFNPFLSGRDTSFGRYLALAGDFKRLNHRMHNKMMTVDGVMAIAGGRNTADEYFFRNGTANFIDFDLLITGDVVDHLGELFDMYWNSEQVIPVAAAAHPVETAATLRHTFDELVAPEYAPPMVVPTGPDLFKQLPFSQTLAAHQMQWIAAPATAHADSPLKASLSLANSAAAEDTVRRRAMALLPHAHSEIIMFSPYFIPGDEGIAEFKQLRERGIEIKVITNSLPTSDEPLVNVGYEYYRTPLLQMGTKVYELSSSRLEHIPFMQRALRSSKGQLHAKMGFIDREFVLIGSMNMDPRSAKINTELGMSVHSPELASMILAVYQVDHLEGTYQVTLKDDGVTPVWTSIGADGKPNSAASEDEPDSNWWERLQLKAQHFFVGDDLL
jgi:putative cardiolipin synthase